MGFLLKYVFIGAAIGIVIAILTSRSEKKRGDTINSITADLKDKGFIVSRQVFSPGNELSLLIDNENNKWAIVNPRMSNNDVLDFSDLIEYEILEDGESLVKGRVGSAIAGGVLFGGVGAMAGGSRKKKIKNMCNSMSVRVVVNNLNNPQYVIPIISSQIKTDSIVYQASLSIAQEFASLLALIKVRAEM